MCNKKNIGSCLVFTLGIEKRESAFRLKQVDSLSVNGVTTVLQYQNEMHLVTKIASLFDGGAKRNVHHIHMYTLRSTSPQVVADRQVVKSLYCSHLCAQFSSIFRPRSSLMPKCSILRLPDAPNHIIHPPFTPPMQPRKNAR